LESCIWAPDGHLSSAMYMQALEARQIDGVWIPFKVLLRAGLEPGRKDRGEELFTVNEFRLGVDLDPTFAVDFPTGCTVADRFGRVQYEIGENGVATLLPIRPGREPQTIKPTAADVMRAIAQNPPSKGFV